MGGFVARKRKTNRREGSHIKKNILSYLPKYRFRLALAEKFQTKSMCVLHGPLMATNSLQ